MKTNKRYMKIILFILILIVLSGCYYEYNHYSNYSDYRIKIEVDDSVYYDNRDRYQALYADFRGHKIYENDIFYVEGGVYRIKYTYKIDNILYYDSIKLEIYSDTEIKIKGNEVQIYY